ncbi:DNA primase [Halosquirtibacter xylanolyticus]|uniref:DNA primase n=1 Tax=Halosquirtibacter xylanolyticus TaxID=3374599 RepID=UPI003748FFDB|nr:DNA primase [Prolixibacteraceae bacterium]
MIEQKYIDKIIQSLPPIDQVISQFLVLEERGDHKVGMCPFHHGTSESLMVYNNPGMYRCLECGRAGNVLQFIMEHETLSFEQALHLVIKKYNIDLPKEWTDTHDIPQSQKQKLMEISEWCKQFFQHQLMETDEGKSIALSYLTQRGINKEAIEAFHIGYCPRSHGEMTKAAQVNGANIEELEQIGVTIRRDNWIRDRFESRVIFPIHNISGKSIGFGGRTMAENKDKKIAKYINSPETEIYHKSQVLYGLYQAKEEVVATQNCYIVEGYTDVVSMHMAGVKNVVASAGTSLTIEQVRLLRRFTNTVTIIYDGDSAGIGAAIRGVELTLQEGMQVKVVPLPEGEDPDSFARNHSNFKQYILDNQKDFIEYASIARLSQTQNDPISRANAITEIVRLISIIPYHHLRMRYMRECSRLMQIREENLYQELRKFQEKQAEQLHKKQRQVVPPHFGPMDMFIEENPYELEEREILRFLLKYGPMDLMEEPIEGTNRTRTVKVANYIFDELEADNLTSQNRLFQDMFDEYKAHLNQFNFEPNRYFIHHPDMSMSRLASKLLTNKYTESKLWVQQGNYIEHTEDILFTLIPKVVENYKLSRVRKMIKDKITEMAHINHQDDFEKIMTLQRDIQNLKEIEKVLSLSLGQRAFNG